MKNCHILKVRTRDVGNGPGIRVSVWVSGCSHRCKGCHNRDTWKWKQGKVLTQELIEKILKACEPEHIQGLTLTGGDPLFLKNREGIRELCKAFYKKFNGTKDIWLWTGYKIEDLDDCPWLFLYVDTVVDGKYVEALKDVSLPYAGSKNQRVLNIHDYYLMSFLNV